jgi:hypothetical protein
MRLRDGLRRLIQRLGGQNPSAEEERLVALFHNRAELKKELHALDDERHRLLDRLKLQEGATMRVEEQLATLEQYLGRPEEGLKCLAYFHLRAVWRAASRRLEHFSAELARQQKDRERKLQLAEFEHARRARVADVDRELVEAHVLADQLQAEQKLAQQKLAETRGFWNYFRGRSLAESIEGRQLRIESALGVVADLNELRQKIEAEPPPVFEGLGLEGRRTVNLAVLACAESLAARLADGGVGELARQSTLRRVYETNYGGRQECVALMQRSARVIADLERQPEDLADVKARTERLRQTVRYRGESDTIPLQDSLQTPGAPAGANVLLEEYFEIYSALLR